MILMILMKFLITEAYSASPNAREACRQALGGAYLEFYDEKTRLSDYAELLQESLKQNHSALKKATLELKAKEESAKRAAYDLGRSIEKDQKAAIVSALKAQIEELSNLLETTQKRQRTMEQEEKNLRQQLSKLFEIERHNDQKDGGYPLRIEYKNPCPKHRNLCLLSEEDAAQLEKIKVHGSLPEPCERYRSMSRLKNSAFSHQP